MGRPHQIIGAIPLEHERTFVIPLGRYAFYLLRIEGHQVRIQLHYIAVALPEIEIG